jgi:hypothetical protein
MLLGLRVEDRTIWVECVVKNLNIRGIKKHPEFFNDAYFA